MSDSLMAGGKNASRRKRKSRAQEKDSDDELWDSEDDDDTIARIQRAHFAQAAAANSRKRTPARPQRMSHKRKMEAVKNFHDFTKKLKKDTGISIRSLVGNNILELSEFSSEDSNTDSDGLSEEGEFVVNPNAVQELNEENESYIDPETGDIVQAKETSQPVVEPVQSPHEPECSEPPPQTLSISDIINEGDLDLSKNVEIAEVEESELCSEKEELLGIKEEDVSQDFDINKLKEMDEISVKPVIKTEDEKEELNNEENKVDTDEEMKPVNTNALNVRRNIREVMDEKNLDASTLTAQRQESERLARVQEQQRIIREVQKQIAINRQNKIHQKTLSLLQGGSSILKKSSTGQKLNLPNTVLVKLPSGEVKKTMKQGQVEVTKVKPGPSALKDKKEVVEIVDSSSGEESSSSSSDSDDCIMLSDSEVPPSPEAEEDPNNSGLHVNDAYNTPDEKGRVLINIGHPESEEDIFLAPQIARVIKPHQIGGVRFLFDNIIESVERFSTSTGFGCILAHSMGLGKTLQIVCFCDIFLRHTNSKTVLCIMPINTLQNWVAEFNMWLPVDPTNSPLAVHGEVRTRTFPIYVLNDSHKTLLMRAKVVKDWKSTGGVLMIGYELYRLLCMKKDKKPRKKKNAKLDSEKEKEKDDKKSDRPDNGNDDTQESDIKRPEDFRTDKEDGDSMSKIDAESKDDKKEDTPNDEDKKLLDDMYDALVRPGPDLVICDEGHRIKNSHSNISYALKQMRTKRRIVLTGYPLQNNLLEYWCMVDFVRPNYLGSKTEFCNMFERPIQNGQCIDSTPQDIRLMRYRAHVLHSLLVGFVQRRSHAVLQSTLPQKEEYVLLVRMTPLQRKLYDRFMNEVVRSTSVPNPLKAFAICCKIWNHPDVLYNFLKKRSEVNAAIEEDLDLEEIGGVTKSGRPRTSKTPGRKPGKARGATKKPAATIPPNASGPKAPQIDPRAFGNAQFPPNAPYGPQSNTYRADQPNRPYPPYPPYQGSGTGYYPPNQSFNQQYDNTYYSQQQSHGNNYPNQYPPNNPENDQRYSQNFWGGGSYYNNTEYYGNPPQYGNNPPPADYRGSQQQFPTNESSSNARVNTQQFGNNQAPPEVRGNPQPYPGNQTPDFRNNPQQYDSNQSNVDLRRNLPQYPNNQPRPDLRISSQQYPSNQQSPDLRGNQQYPNNQAPVDFRSNPQPYADNAPSDLRTTYPNSQPSPDVRSNQQQYGNNHLTSDIKSNPLPFENNQPLPDVIGSQQLYANNPPSSDLRGNTQQYPNNPNQDFRENPHHYSNNPQSSDLRGSSQQYVNPLASGLRTDSPQYPNNQAPADSRIDQNHFPNNIGGPEFRGPQQQYQGRPPSSEFTENSQQFTNNQPQPDFRNNPQPYSNNVPSSELPKTNPSETYTSPQQFSTTFNPSQNDQVFPGNSLQTYNSSIQNNYSGTQRPPYNTQGYGEYNQSTPTPQYPSNQPSQAYPNQTYPQYPGSSGSFGTNPTPAFNQFGNPTHNYSDYTNQSQANNLTNQPVKADVNIDTNYQSVEKKCDPNLPQNPRDLSYNNSAFNYQQPSSSFYHDAPGTGICHFGNFNSGIETKPPLDSANSGSSIPSWPIPETLKTEVDKLKAEEKMEIKSESDGEVKIEDLDTKKIVKDESKQLNNVNNVYEQMPTTRVDNFTAINTKSDIKAADNSETEQETPKQVKRRGRPKDSKNKDKSKQKPKVKAKGRKDRKNSKENESESDDSEKEQKLNKGEEMALAKKAEEMTYDWAAELLKDYIPGIIENSAKMDLFFYILNESIKLGDRLLLFSQSLFTLNLIEDFLERNYIPGTNRLWERNTSYYRLDGSTHALEREKLINEFNANPNIYLFLVSTRAGSLGINLVGANRVIVFDASWNPCHDTQAVCRVYRYGQRKPCFVYRFVMDWCLEKKIYDRQINKQGMADRVVDECNPDAVLSMKEITNLCFDNDEKESDAKDLSEHKDKYIDILMQGIITLHGKLLSKEPFQHESLLVDRKEKKLSSAEKRLAQRGYELEKKAALAPKPTGAYRTVRAADGSLVQRPVASVRPMQHGGARWIPADVWRRQGMTAQEMTLPLDVVIPTNSAEKTNIVLKAGQRVMVLKSPKGIYMQLESGKIIAIKTSLKGLQKGVDNKDSPVGKKGTRPLSTNIPGSLKNNSAITITSKTGPRPGFNRLIRPAMLQHKIGRPMLPGQKIADIRNRLGELRSYSPIRVRSPIPPGRLLRPTLPGSVSITRIPRETKKSDIDSDKGANKTSSEDDAHVLDSDDEDESGPKEANQSTLHKEGKDDKNTDNIIAVNNTPNDCSVETNNDDKNAVDTNTVEENATDNLTKSITLDSKMRDSTDKEVPNNEVQPMVLTTDEKLPSEEALESKITDEISDLSMSSQSKVTIEIPHSNTAEPIERKINLLKNYRHQRPGSRPQTESSLSQLEKTASALNKEGAPDFRKNLDDITQSYSPGLEDKSSFKSKKKKSPAKPLTPESHIDKLPAPINMSHSVSNLLGTSSSNIIRKVDPTLHQLPSHINSQSILSSHGNSSMPQDSAISTTSQPHGFSIPQNFSTNSISSGSSSMGHGSAMSSSSGSPPMDVVKVPAVPSVPPIAIPTPQPAYPAASVSALSADRPYGQYPGYSMGYGAYPSGWEFGAYGAAPPYYPAYAAPPYAPTAAPPAHPAHPPHPAHPAHPPHPAHPAHPGLPPDGYMPPNPQW